MEIYITDGQSGMNTAEAKAELKRPGTELRVRAPGQHARIIEIRNAMLRQVMHLIEEDLKRFNITTPFKRLLGEAIFVCNALFFL